MNANKLACKQSCFLASTSLRKCGVSVRACKDACKRAYKMLESFVRTSVRVWMLAWANKRECKSFTEKECVCACVPARVRACHHNAIVRAIVLPIVIASVRSLKRS